MPPAQRPEILFPLFAPVTSLPGVGPRIGNLIERVVGEHVVDLLWHLPNGIIDRRFAPPVSGAIAGRVATLTVTVDEHRPPPAGNRRVPYKIACSDNTGSILLIFFHARADYLKKTLPLGEERIVSGTVERFGDDLQMAHPDYIVPVSERPAVETVQPVYALTAGLSAKVLGNAVQSAIGRAPHLPEWLDPAYLTREGWPDWYTALGHVHHPQNLHDLEAGTLSRQRLAYDELLASQLAVALIRAQFRRRPGRAIVGDGTLRQQTLAALPFQLTGGQETAIAEITADMGSSTRMMRLLQGDVGSGKTVVALIAMLAAVESGAQAALMAPTEILARQHFETIAPLAKSAGVRTVLLTGRDKGKARQEILDGMANGDIAIAVGTHALFQSDVTFADLALAVIDEQHRFGVDQRMQLTDKGRSVDVLVMTATPIPRTLMLAAYGDLDESRLTEKPAGRQPIDTRTIGLDRMSDVVAAVGRQLQAGAKVYWVCPLVEESETSDLAAATDRQKTLAMHFGDHVGLVHGRMTGSEKDSVMARFSGTDPEAPSVNLLVATTVIEVGVDVPDATIMVVEHAERFGLAQLHQLRGRIGRGDAPSTCLLLYAEPLGETARSRLRIMRETNDGFIIAEEDLRLRGAGEVLGTRQSGLPDFRLADLSVHAELLATARDDARLIVERDPGLANERGQALRVLLYLFQRDIAVRYASAG